MTLYSNNNSNQERPIDRRRVRKMARKMEIILNVIMGKKGKQLTSNYNDI
jgi:hypothetical protein